MSVIEILLIALSLSMDAFSVSVCSGLKMKRFNLKNALIIALFFGGFQALMPLIGWFAGSRVLYLIEAFDHYIAFGLLVIIGAKMIYDSIFEKKDCDSCNSGDRIDYKELTLAAIATSIDALAVGITFAIDYVNIPLAVSIIGAVTFTLCFAGVFIGNRFGSKYGNVATIIGGSVLILLGVKILLEGLGVI